MTRCEPRTVRQRLEDRVPGDAALLRGSARPATRPPSPAIATNRCSVLTYSSFSRSASCSAASVTWRRRGESASCDAAVRARQPVELGPHRGRQRGRVRVHLADDRRDDAVLLLDQREQQVLGQDLGMALRDRPAAARARIASWAFSVYLLMFMRCAPFSSASAQRLVVFPLFLGQRAGQLDVDGRVEIAALVGLADAGMPWPFSRNTWPFCVRLGNLQADAAGDRRHLRLAAEHRRRDRHGDLRVQVVALALEDRDAAAAARADRDRRSAAVGARSPSPAARTREPSLTPAGIRTSTLRACPSCLIEIRRVAPWNASSSVSSTACSMSRPFWLRGARAAALARPLAFPRRRRRRRTS